MYLSSDAIGGPYLIYGPPSEGEAAGWPANAHIGVTLPANVAAVGWDFRNIYTWPLHGSGVTVKFPDGQSFADPDISGFVGFTSVGPIPSLEIYSPGMPIVMNFSFALGGDNVPPSTQAFASPDPNVNGWNNTNVTVNVNATDNPGGTGVKQIQFALGGAQNTGWQTVAGNAASVTISAEGTTILSYFAADNAGNQETVKTLTVRIDKTPPIISGLPAPGCTIWPPNHKLVQVAFGLRGPLCALAMETPALIDNTSRKSRRLLTMVALPLSATPIVMEPKLPQVGGAESNQT